MTRDDSFEQVEFILYVALTGLAAGALVVGWILHVEGIVRLGAAYPAMVPATALGLLLLGLSGIASTRGRTGLSMALILFAGALVAALFLLQQAGLRSIAGLQVFGIGERDIISPATALFFVAAMLAAVLQAQRAELAPIAGLWGLFLLSTAIGVAVVAASGVGLARSWPLYGMAFQTALAFALYFAALSIGSLARDSL
ncbi:hypothetical protein ACFORG_04855 [Lutimaribacter marinistellae]|uniref:Uncharacterized protein n=1 Tax=Lutimaribacter marinistellae TaxID=1820329 RepID=A0ABV7TE64_9RHOB